MWEHVPLGKQYRIDLDSIHVEHLHITEERLLPQHPRHHKEIVHTDDGQWLCTECLYIPGYNSKEIYTHKDKDGVLWRFENGSPISIIADEIMEEFGFK